MSEKPYQIQSVVKSGNRVEASVQFGDTTSTIFFECDDPALTPMQEALVALTLFPAMRAGVELQVGGGVSKRVLGNLPELQELIHTWMPDHFQPVPVTGAVPVEKKNRGATRVGSFFSGGVDGWYTLLKHRDEITDLILVWGFDIPLDKSVLFDQVRQNAQRVADEMGKNLVVVKTNLREVIDPLVAWKWMHGLAIAAVANALSGEFQRIYISTSQWHGHQPANGSHLQLDPLWSPESLELVHEGLEATRLEKIHQVAQHDIALQTLRVCYLNLWGAYNCGRCEKCLRTMVALQIVGALERCTTFRGPIDTRRIRQLRFLDRYYGIYNQENLHALAKQPWNRELYRAVRYMLTRYHIKEFLLKMHELHPRFKFGTGRWTKKIGKLE